MKVITMYEAYDGTRFDSEASCVQHEEYLKFCEQFFKCRTVQLSELFEHETQEIAQWLWENFDIKRKEK